MKLASAIIGLATGMLLCGSAFAGHGHWGHHRSGVGFGLYLGGPAFWPYYGPYPRYYYSPPPVYYSSPPPVVVQSAPSVIVERRSEPLYVQPAPPGSPSNPIVELPSRETVTVPSPHQQLAQAQQDSTQLFIYPRQGQTEQQQSSDRDQCNKWALGQIGFDPSQSVNSLTSTQVSNYHRAMDACLDARGYTVR